MTLLDPNQTLPEGELIPDAEWLGTINGLIRSSLTVERVESLINQAFDQSPYLNKN